MGMSSQRLIIIVLLTNLILTLGIALYEDPRSITYSDIVGETIYLGDNSTGTVEGESDRVQPTNQQEEGSYTNNLRMTKVLYDLFIRGFVKLPFTENSFDEPLEKALAITIIIVRLFLALTVIVEIIMIFKNRKTT